MPELKTAAVTYECTWGDIGQLAKRLDVQGRSRFTYRNLAIVQARINNSATDASIVTDYLDTKIAASGTRYRRRKPAISINSLTSSLDSDA